MYDIIINEYFINFHDYGKSYDTYKGQCRIHDSQEAPGHCKAREDETIRLPG